MRRLQQRASQKWLGVSTKERNDNEAHAQG